MDRFGKGRCRTCYWCAELSGERTGAGLRHCHAAPSGDFPRLLKDPRDVVGTDECSYLSRRTCRAAESVRRRSRPLAVAAAALLIAAPFCGVAGAALLGCAVAIAATAGWAALYLEWRRL